MKACILSYSMTGNNKLLAQKAAGTVGCELIEVQEKKKRKVGKIVLDMIFNRTPDVTPEADILKDYDLIIFIGPVWMGQAATPFRTYFDYIKNHDIKYAYSTICGGALHENPTLIEDLEKRIGREPELLKGFFIKDLLDIEEPTMKDTSSYKISNEEAAKMVIEMEEALRNIL